ncbi:VOC family protein [Salininema proteolyticum]|uniref:VOC family protein n=1 Tax=Salininema proteolyticum TaxID=1607685 RepID=A0ABV8TUT7_9ACTN
MVSFIRQVTFDCHDAYGLSKFWEQVTGFREYDHDPNLPGQEEAYLVNPEKGTNLLFLQVPEGKTVKNRLHLDIVPTDRTRDEEVDRLLGIGAELHRDHRADDGTGFVVLTDPEGNEFCVERSVSERPLY